MSGDYTKNTQGLRCYIYNIYFVHLIKKYSFSNKYSTIINKQFQFMQYTSLVNT